MLQKVDLATANSPPAMVGDLTGKLVEAEQIITNLTKRPLLWWAIEQGNAMDIGQPSAH